MAPTCILEAFFSFFSVSTLLYALLKMKCLKDLDSTEGSVQLHSRGDDGHLILHPQPNPNDPNDPFRWVSR